MMVARCACISGHLVEVEGSQQNGCGGIELSHAAACPCLYKTVQTPIEAISLLVGSRTLGNDFTGTGYHVPVVFHAECVYQFSQFGNNLGCRETCGLQCCDKCLNECEVLSVLQTVFVIKWLKL